MGAIQPAARGDYYLSGGEGESTFIGWLSEGCRCVGPEDVARAAVEALLGSRGASAESVSIGGGFNWSTSVIVCTEEELALALGRSYLAFGEELRPWELEAVEEPLPLEGVFGGEVFLTKVRHRVHLRLGVLWEILSRSAAVEVHAGWQCTWVGDRPCPPREIDIPRGRLALRRHSRAGNGGTTRYSLLGNLA